jgi:alkanesulfonate monooxygenase SsuD/methylene tetrahydromethanopterin reductase-like flavin-dependent oxidoreductase (luciferase family)
MPLAARALQEDKYLDINKYPEQVADLIGFLHNSLPAGHPFASLIVSPSISTVPEVRLLGSSDESARMAALQGTAYACPFTSNQSNSDNNRSHGK